LTSSVFTQKYTRFCEILIEARHNRNLTQIQLAEILGKPQSYVSKYERGERRLDVIEFLEVTKVLEIDACEIIKQLETEDT